jgi:cell migration-inducing and hyaluronan-binding protein
MIMGGTLSLHGDRTNSWTKLSRTADAGSNAIEGPERRWLAGR